MENILQNLYSWVMAVPTNLIIIVVIALALKILGKSLKAVI